MSNEDKKRINFLKNIYDKSNDKNTFSKNNLQKIFYFQGKSYLFDVIDFQLFKSNKKNNKLIELKKHFEVLQEIGGDTSGLELDMKPIKKYARLRWYNDVIEKGNSLLEKVKKRYKEEFEKKEMERKSLMEEVKKLFEECFSRELDIEDRYDMNDKAMEAYECGDFNKAEELFYNLRKDLGTLIDEDDRRKTVWEEFDHLKENPYRVPHPEKLESLIEEDVYFAEEKLKQWKNSIEEAKIAEEKRIKEEQEAKRRAEEEQRQRKEEERRKREYKKRVEKLEDEVSRFKEKAASYALDIKKENALIQKASDLFQQGELLFAEEYYVNIKGRLKDAINRYEKKRRREEEERKCREKKERRRREEERKKLISSPNYIWEHSKRIETIRSKVQISKKGFLKKKYEYKQTEVNVEVRKNSLGMEFVKIPNRGYYMGQYTITQKEWKAVMGTEPWKEGYHIKEGNNYPATYISWNDSQEFVKKLNVIEGVEKYRLPSEEEWEHACRAGSSTKYCFGDDRKQLKNFSWYGGGEEITTMDIGRLKGERYAHQVGQKNPNKWGLFDIHGNVWEWTSKKYNSGYISCGGSWESIGDFCQSNSEWGSGAAYRGYDIGIRLVRTI